ncbi:MAG: hypothetical protein Kow0037_05160 [Calditrichia bacterium]
MKRINVVLLTLLIAVFLGGNLFAQEYSYDYKQMKMDEYKIELAKWQKCEAENKAKIAEEEAKSAQLNQEIAAVENEINTVQDEIYALLTTNKNDFESYLGNLKTLENDLSGFVAMSPEDIYTRKDELEGMKQRLAELKQDKNSLHSKSQGYIASIENLISQAEEKAKPAAAGRYEVMKGDYLWKIAKRPDVYGDPYAWIRIYTYNKDQISNPDLIYPNQVFRIPRMAGPNEHWVQKGEFLYKIAGYSNVYGNSFKWQKLYEANKDVISDPNVIFPHMVLTIPRD